MSRGSIEELERQIKNTRQALDQTLHALRFQLSPRHQAQLAWQFARDRTRRSLRAGADWAGAHPVPVLLAGLALGSALGLGVARLRRGTH